MSSYRNNFFTTVYSYLFGRTVERVQGEINPMLEIVHLNGRYILNSENANYSWGTLKDVFAKTFRKLDVRRRDIGNVLILGYGTGSVASILLEDYKMHCSVTGVEKDKAVIDLAYKYYKLNRNEKVNIIHDDAISFIKTDRKKYDLVIVDIYIDNKVPSQCETDDFLRDLKSSLKERSLLVFNKMFFDNETKESAGKLYERFNNIFGNASSLMIHKHHTNLMIYHEHGLKSGIKKII